MGEDEARVLAQRLLATALPRRWRHVQAVAAAAGRMSDDLEIDRNVVVSAAWLHDIGYAPTVAHTGFHPLDGARYLRRGLWDDAVCRLVAHHTDAACQAVVHGLDEQLRLEFGEMNGLARDVLWTADATTGPNGEPMALEERVTEIGRRYGQTHAVTRGMIASRDALASAIARVDMRLAGVRAHV